jgi:cation diffusion facilitator CzcD-associated flavoprotein CzcO
VWRVRTDGGETITCRHYVMASGCLSVPKSPDIEGADRFAGEVYFTAVGRTRASTSPASASP